MTKPDIIEAIFNRIDDWENGAIDDAEIISVLKTVIKAILELPKETDE